MNNNTYIRCANNNDLRVIDMEISICSLELVTDNFGRGGDPFVVPLSVTKIL
jgi:hypothetical protein